MVCIGVSMKKIILLFIPFILFGQFKFQTSRPDRYYKIYIPGINGMYDKDITQDGWGIYQIYNLRYTTANAKFGERVLLMNHPYNTQYSQIFINKSNYTVPYGNEYTFDCWVYPILDNSFSGYGQQIFFTAYRSGCTTIGIIFNCLGNKEIYFKNDNGSSIVANYFSPNNSCPLNTWTHIAQTRKGDTVYCFINGKLLNKTYTTANFANQTPYVNVHIGCLSDASYTYNFSGSIALIRFSEKARWTSDFTPPNKPY